MITSWTPVVIYRIGKQLGLSADGALLAGRLIAWSPAFAFWSGALYKEGLILLLLSLAVLHTLRLQTRFQWHAMLLMAGCLAGLFGLRPYIAALMCVVLCLGLLLGRGGNRGLPSIVVGFRQLFILAGFVALLIWFGLTRTARATLPGSVHEALTTISISRQDLAQEAASGFSASTTFASPADAISFLPVGLVYFLLAPLPWQLGQLRQTLAIPETVCWTCLYPIVIWGISRGMKRNPQGSVLLLAAAASMTVLYALSLGNIGSIYRMRIQVWLIFAVFAGWGWEAWREKRPRRAQTATVRRFRKPV
jgi:hypothetical protein